MGKPNLKVGNCAIFITYITLYIYILLFIYICRRRSVPFRRSFVCCTQIERANDVLFLRVSAYELRHDHGTNDMTANCIVGICVTLDVWMWNELQRPSKWILLGKFVLIPYISMHVIIAQMKTP